MDKFTWSYTSLNTFLTCPMQYAAKYVYKTVPYQTSEAIIWGNRVHAAAETKLKGGEPDDPDAYSEVSSYCDFFDKVKAESGCTRLVEYEIAITDKWKPTTWFAADACGRSKLDLVHINDNAALIYDWKTGKMKQDPLQLKIFCVMLALAKPELDFFQANFIWLKEKKIIGIEGLFRKDLLPVIKEINELIIRVKEAIATEIFIQKRSGLCKKWCEVKECPNCGV